MCSGCGNVRELGRIQGFPDENPVAPGTNESFFRLTAKEVRPVIDNLGKMEFVSRTEIGKRQSQPNRSLHFWGVWHTGNIAIELPTEENFGEATAFMRCFSESGSLKVTHRA